MKIKTEVYGRHPTRFDMTGKSLPVSLFLSEEGISIGLAKRIYRYALEALDSAGFLEAVKDWDVTVCADDVNEQPSDRQYWVQWENSDGGGIQVVGILTKSGWPTIDHGLNIYR